MPEPENSDRKIAVKMGTSGNEMNVAVQVVVSISLIDMTHVNCSLRLLPLASVLTETDDGKDAVRQSLSLLIGLGKILPHLKQ